MPAIPGTRRTAAMLVLGVIASLITAWIVSQAMPIGAQQDTADDRDPPPAPRMGTLDNPLTAEEMRQHFAGEMARRDGISVDEATAALQAQAESSETSAQLEATLPDRLAGVWIEREPEFHIVAWYTGNDDGLQEAKAIAADSPVPVEIRTGASHTLAGLVAISDAIAGQFEADGDLAGLWVEVQTGTIHIMLMENSPREPDLADLADRLTADYGAPIVVHPGEGRSGDD